MLNANDTAVDVGAEKGGKGAKGGPKGAGGAKGGKKGGGPSDIEKILRMAMVRNYTPTIVFSFSKKECEENAKYISKLDFSNDDEKKMIAQIFSNAIDSLSDDDKKLPQVRRRWDVNCV